MHFKSSTQAGQFLKPNSKQLDMSTFFISNLQLFAFIILGYLMIASATAILPKLAHSTGRFRLKNLKLILFKAPFMDHNRLPRIHLKLMFFFFSLFLFFNLNFIGGIIKTDKCTMDSSEIIDSDAKLIGTSKTLLTNFDNDFRIKSAPKNSFLKKLTKNERLVFGKIFVNLLRRGVTKIDDYVIFTEQILMAWVLSLLARWAKTKDKNSVVFLKSTGYYETYCTFSLRRSLDAKRKRLINSRCVFRFIGLFNFKLIASPIHGTFLDWDLCLNLAFCRL